jgi:hypothetical protein
MLWLARANTGAGARRITRGSAERESHREGRPVGPPVWRGRVIESSESLNLTRLLSPIRLALDERPLFGLRPKRRAPIRALFAHQA